MTSIRTLRRYPRLLFVEKDRIYRAGKIISLLFLAYASNVESMKTAQQLSAEAISEFKAIYRDEFGDGISDDEAQEIAIRLLRFFGILARPNSGEQDGENSAS